MSRNAHARVKEEIDAWDYVIPCRFAAKNDSALGVGVLDQLRNCSVLLQAEACVLREPQVELVNYPYGPAFPVEGLVHIQDLASAIEAPHT
jgi:hypothetical protein